MTSIIFRVHDYQNDIWAGGKLIPEISLCKTSVPTRKITNPAIVQLVLSLPELAIHGDIFGSMKDATDDGKQLSATSIVTPHQFLDVE